MSRREPLPRSGSLTSLALAATLKAVQRFTFGAVLAVLVGTALSGCSGACADSIALPPALTVDTTEWFLAHPGTSVRVCLQTACATETADQVVGGRHTITIPMGATTYGDHARVDAYGYRGSVTEAHSARTVTFTENPCLPSCGACVPLGRSAKVQLAADGAIQQR